MYLRERNKFKKFGNEILFLLLFTLSYYSWNLYTLFNVKNIDPNHD